MILDPGRGASEGRRIRARPTDRGSVTIGMLRTRTFFYNTAGMAAVTFASGGYAAWGPTFYQTVRGMTAPRGPGRIGAWSRSPACLGSSGTWLADPC